MGIQHAISKLAQREHLTAAESEAAMSAIMRGEATQAQIGGYLMALRLKGETVDEIIGGARAMREAAHKVPVRDTSRLVDTCGTGGDGAHTFNISTTVAFVVAGAGVPVAKHGNRSVSSQCGSADVLSALGVNLNLTPEQVSLCIDEIGIGFLFAPHFHPAMKHAVQPRRELGVRTLFNILGPLTNPAGAARQLLGVYDASLTEPLAHVLRGLGAQAALVVHGADGLDELSTVGENRISELRDGDVRTYTLDPRELGFARCEPSALRGGDPQENAAITRRILSGEMDGGKRDVVLLNAAAALVAGGAADSLADGVRLAAESLESGAALSKLDALIAYSQRFAQPAM